jgi:16S rRNA processing protein RimM
MYITIGTITNTHGINGAVTVKTDSDFKESRYKKGNKLYIQLKNEVLEVTVKGYFPKSTLDVLTFEEFSNIDEVLKFKTCALLVKDSDREALEEDAYYYSDLIGLKVYTDTLIGSVKEVRDMPQGEMLVVERENKKDALIPFRKEFVKEVTEDKIVIIEMEGLL